MPRRLENDRWLFGTTLALCLLGAVMIFSASAVTAEQQYGHSYIFLLRQAIWLAIGLVGMLCSCAQTIASCANRPSFIPSFVRFW